MPRAVSQKQFNSFINGIITDANEFNAPENAVYDCENVDINSKGEARRRLGLTGDSDDGARTAGLTATTVSQQATQVLEWNNAGASRDKSLVAIQQGRYLYVYERDSTSQDFVYGTYDNLLGGDEALWDMVVGDDGALYVMVKYGNIKRFDYNGSGYSLTSTSVIPIVRDTIGVNDSLEVDEMPSSLSANHHYNLLNQGWTDTLINTFAGAVQTPNAVIGTDCNIYECSADHTAGTSNHPITGASWATYWTLAPSRTDDIWVWTSGTNYKAVAAGSNYPSNSQQWFQGRDSSNNFSPAELLKLDFGSAPAPRGRFLFPLNNIQRSAIVTGATDGSSFNAGANCMAYYAGRLWIGGYKDDGYGSTLFYSQIVRPGRNAHGDEYFNAFYSDNDVTSEFFNEILASDGGRLEIPNMGLPIRMVPLGKSLIIFTESGIWSVNGGFSTNFSPTEVSADFLSPDVLTSPLSVVNAEGSLFYWTRSGIKSVTPQPPDGWVVSPITENRFQEGYNDIISSDPNVLPSVRGFFDTYNRVIEWSYSQQDTYGKYFRHNRILKLKLATGAITRYVLAPTDKVGIMGMASNRYAPQRVHYLTQEDVTTQVSMKWCSFNDDAFEDYYTVITPISFDSYLTTWPYHLGAPDKDKEAPYISTFLRRTEQNWTAAATYDYPSACSLSIWWEWATVGASYRKSGPHNIYRWINGPTDPGSGYPVAVDYDKDIIVNKVKVNGSGKAFQMKFDSTTAKDFQLLGWSAPVLVETRA